MDRSFGDEQELTLICRADLDSFWSCKADTIMGFIGDAKWMVRRALGAHATLGWNEFVYADVGEVPESGTK